MIRFLLFLIIIFLPAFLVIKLFLGAAKKRVSEQKKSSWKGKLIDKQHLEYEEEDSSYTKDLYTLYFKTIEGEQIKINVSKKVYEEWKIGDKAKKDEGKLLPEKTS